MRVSPRKQVVMARQREKFVAATVRSLKAGSPQAVAAENSRDVPKWKSVLLLDEADAFLEQGSLHDVHRNALVSVFLRELEYYQGIIFLTTNRVSQIDDAIASRIHLPLKYKSLGLDARGVYLGELPEESCDQKWRSMLQSQGP